MSLKTDVEAAAAAGDFGQALILLAKVLDNETPNATDVTYAAGKGPVVHDSSDGHTYRLGTTAGVVALTQLT